MTDYAATTPQPQATVADYTERELISRIQLRLAPAPDWLVVGIGDDAAVVEPERNRIEVVTVDAVLDGVHFNRAFVPPHAIGHRALAVNLSDLAAMGAAPRFAVVSMALPGELPIADFDGIASGIATLAAAHRLHVIGGNLTRTPGPLAIDITAVGTVKRRQALTRAGARVGDELYVTGSIGGAAAGLQMLSSGAGTSSAAGRLASSARSTADDRPAPVDAYLYPQPRIRVGTLLSRNRVATACIDLSDGFADGVRQIARASGVGVEVDGSALPIDPSAREWFTSMGVNPVAAAIAASDDYELLFTVRPRLRRQLTAVMRQADVPLTKVGVCTEPADLSIDGSPIPAGYGHFR